MMQLLLYTRKASVSQRKGPLPEFEIHTIDVTETPKIYYFHITENSDKTYLDYLGDRKLYRKDALPEYRTYWRWPYSNNEIEQYYLSPVDMPDSMKAALDRELRSELEMMYVYGR